MIKWEIKKIFGDKHNEAAEVFYRSDNKISLLHHYKNEARRVISGRQRRPYQMDKGVFWDKGDRLNFYNEDC